MDIFTEFSKLNEVDQVGLYIFSAFFIMDTFHTLIGAQWIGELL